MDIDKMVEEILDERILNDGGWKKYNDGITKAVQVIREYQANGIDSVEEKLYKIRKLHESPTGRIHVGVSKTEEEWQQVFPNLEKGDCSIKQDWFECVDKRFSLADIERIINTVDTLEELKYTLDLNLQK